MSVHKDVTASFVIWAPDYTHLSSGIRCLYLLCHHLNRLGYEAYISGRNAPANLSTRYLDQEKIGEFRANGGQDIAIYPEILKENVFSSTRVVRYLLNKPGVITRTTMSDYGASDFFIHYADEFAPKGITSRRLRIPTLDTTVYRQDGPPVERSGFLLYSSRVVPDPADIPDWVRPRTTLSWADPVEPTALAALYRSSRALVTWERTAAVTEAIHCGCPVILVPHPTFDHEPIVRRNLGCGVVVGWDRGGLDRAARTVPISKLWYRLRSALLARRVHRFARQAQLHFGYRG